MRLVLNDSTAVPEPPRPDAREFHRRLPGYEPTPLLASDCLRQFGLGELLIKVETARFGLPSFKILGASWAIYCELAKRNGSLPEGEISSAQILEWNASMRDGTLVAATDGNHGRAVARCAAWLGMSARIFVPAFVSVARRRAIEAEGADVEIVDGSYDNAVDAAESDAARRDSILISDTARNYTDETPARVVDGYQTIFKELDTNACDKLDLVVVQAGVGGLAAAATSWAANRSPAPPRVVVVEPEGAACVAAAIVAGHAVTVDVAEVTLLGCLACGTVSATALPVLCRGVSCCLAIGDDCVIDAMRMFDQIGVLSGPNGAAGLAGLLSVLRSPLRDAFCAALDLHSESRILAIATEHRLAEAP